jgi:hypothetical protein
MDIPRLREQLKTIHNLCEISLLVTNREDLLPSILEVLYWEAQNMVETQCVVE